MLTLILAALVAVWCVSGAFWNVQESGLFAAGSPNFTKLDWLVSGPLVWLGLVYIYFRDKVLP